ncbi:hypothetical protein [Demequina litorisediminis]|uniref:hypothetical protein n=1 Tax=Demequina litorisediminis TaxID=1849022 RepID=UPI0024E16030|nr:hypothetical protein [Demequina litorisediminis]
MRTQPLAIAALVAASGIVLTACSSDDASAPEASGSASAATAAVEPTTLTVTSPAGSTIEMPTEPESALGFYTTDIDMLITLGFSLADEQPIREDFTTFPSFFPQEEPGGHHRLRELPRVQPGEDPPGGSGLHPQRPWLRGDARRRPPGDRPHVHVQRLRRRRLARQFREGSRPTSAAPSSGRPGTTPTRPRWPRCAPASTRRASTPWSRTSPTGTAR